jgi:ketosteroid isomerase-like protein
MNDQTQARPIDPAELPATITRYLDAHRLRDTAMVIGTFTGDAVVIDDGSTHAGTEAIEKWLTGAASEYTYTTRLTAANKIDDAHYTVTNHLEGDFPGGQVDLRYRFTLRDGLIGNLTIEP